VRIVFVGPLPPIRGGISQHSAGLVRALRELGHDVSAWSWKHQYPARLYRSEQLDRDATPFSDARFALNWYDPTSWIRAGRDAKRADLLVTPWVHPVQGPPLRTIASAAGSTPTVAVVHNVLPHERIRFDDRLARLFLRRCTAAIVQAQPQADALTQLVPSLTTHVVPMPALLPVRAAPLPEAPPVRVLFLGYVRPYKGLDLAIDAIELLRDSHDIRLTVAGDFWEPTAEACAADLARRDLDKLVTLRPGYAPDDVVNDLLAQHHLVIAPYRHATQSGIVPLAHAADRTVVITPVPSLVEQAAVGRSVVASAIDAPAIATALTTACQQLVSPSTGAADRAPNTWAAFAGAVVTAGTVRRSEES
jgi:glycosyltransferase involved in cell wall biosynthesis